jgi:hypothetical protein
MGYNNTYFASGQIPPVNISVSIVDASGNVVTTDSSSYANLYVYNANNTNVTLTWETEV